MSIAFVWVVSNIYQYILMNSASLSHVVPFLIYWFYRSIFMLLYVMYIYIYIYIVDIIYIAIYE